MQTPLGGVCMNKHPQSEVKPYGSDMNINHCMLCSLPRPSHHLVFDHLQSKTGRWKRLEVGLAQTYNNGICNVCVLIPRPPSQVWSLARLWPNN